MIQEGARPIAGVTGSEWRGGGETLDVRGRWFPADTREFQGLLG